MEIKEALRSLFQEMILPEFDQIKVEQQKLVEKISSVDKRLDDITAHLIDQSRRIDDINKRIDETNKRIDETNKRIDETNIRIDSARDELVSMIGEINKRIDRLYEVIVRRDEHIGLEIKLENLVQRIEAIERKVAA
jgi:predicted  nucleic acid-binding Zn-ribbon protein